MLNASSRTIALLTPRSVFSCTEWHVQRGVRSRVGAAHTFLCGARHRDTTGLDTACGSTPTAFHREANAHVARDGHDPDTDLIIRDVNYLQLVTCELDSMLEFCSFCAAFGFDKGISPGGRADIKKGKQTERRHRTVDTTSCSS